MTGKKYSMQSNAQMLKKVCYNCKHPRKAHGISGCLEQIGIDSKGYEEYCRCKVPSRSDITHIGTEPIDHYVMKYNIRDFLDDHGFYARVEYRIPAQEYRGYMIQFPVDVYATNSRNGQIIIVQVDGPIHQQSQIQINKTKNRNMAIMDYCKATGASYYIVNKDTDTSVWKKELTEIIELCNKQNNQ